MSKHDFIDKLEPGNVSATYQVRDAKLLKTVKGDDYLTLTLADRSGEIPAKIWQAPPDILSIIKPGFFLEIDARVETYRERNQIIIDKFEVIDRDRVELSTYLVTAPVDPEVVYNEITEMLEGMSNPWLVKLAHVYLNDDVFGKRFRTWPAAKKMHHPYHNGLLEHMHSVMKLGQGMAAHYSWVDADLVLMGLFLHDSGKVIELVEEPAPAYSVEGELLGHITIGICKLDELARDIDDFPSELLVQLKHIILSHHGISDYGSPKPPMFAEALLVHTVEMLDAKVNAFYRERNLPAENKDDTGDLRYSKLLHRFIYNPPENPSP